MHNELDVQIHVSECLPDFGGNCHLDSAMPTRRPNVISHRGHELTVNVRILSLPSDTTDITLRAYVIAYGPDRLGTQDFIFRAADLFGVNPGESFPVPSTLPADLSIRVSELGSDHLGQGPYEVIVNVEPRGGGPPVAPVEGEEGDATPPVNETSKEDTSNGINIIENRTFFLKFISL